VASLSEDKILNKELPLVKLCSAYENTFVQAMAAYGKSQELFEDFQDNLPLERMEKKAESSMGFLGRILSGG